MTISVKMPGTCGQRDVASNVRAAMLQLFKVCNRA